MRVVAVMLICVISPSLQGSAAQAVTGFVAVVETEERVENAQVTLQDVSGTPIVAAMSGQNGEFHLDAPNPGTYSVRIRRIGFKPASAQVILQTGRTLEVRVNLAPQATELEALTVYGVTADTPEQLEFLSRRHLPWNYSLDRTEIDQLHLGNIGEVIDFGVPIKPLGCRVVYLDGHKADLSLIDRGRSDLPLDWIYGIEVYRSYFDIPLRYRDPELKMQCGAILLWTTTPPGYDTGIGTTWSLAMGTGSGWELALFEFGWRPAKADSYASTARLRFGWHRSEALLGDELARREGVEPNAVPLFASIYVGKQGPIPLMPRQRAAYARLAVGMSMYLGQGIAAQPTDDSTFVVEPPTTARFGIGAEFALGFRYPRGRIRPWVELRTGAERVLEVGVRWARPLLMLGIEVGGN